MTTRQPIARAPRPSVAVAPWARKLIFTTESPNAPTYSATPDYPSTVEDVSGSLGRGGYEGVSVDSEAT